MQTHTERFQVLPEDIKYLPKAFAHVGVSCASLIALILVDLYPKASLLTSWGMRSLI